MTRFPVSEKNYIRRLELGSKLDDAYISALIDGMIDLEAYLTSNKFHDDTKVEVADVLRRLSEIRSHAADRVVATSNEETEKRKEKAC